MLGATSSPLAPCSTPRPEGEGGRQRLGCKIAKRRPTSVTGLSSEMGRKHPPTESTQSHWSQTCVLLAKTNWRCWSFKNCLGERAGWQRCWESTTAGRSRSTGNTQKHLLASQPHLGATLKLCNPLPLTDKGVQSFPSCCTLLRCT